MLPMPAMNVWSNNFVLIIEEGACFKRRWNFCEVKEGSKGSGPSLERVKLS